VRSPAGLAAAVIATLAPTVTSAVHPVAPTVALPVITSALWMGDSIAYELAPGVETALTAAGVEIASHAFPGISLTEDSWMPPGETWIDDHHEPMLAASDADVVIWELSLFDTLSPRDVLLSATRRSSTSLCATTRRSSSWCRRRWPTVRFRTAQDGRLCRTSRSRSPRTTPGECSSPTRP